MRVILHSLKSLDFFGPKINFTIKRETNFKSVLGGLVSLIVYCLYIFFFIYFGKDMIFRLNPTVTFEIINPESQESYQISDETFFAWRVEDFYGNPYSNTSDLLNVYLTYEVFDNYESKYINFTLFQSLNCRDKKFEKMFENSIYNETLDKWNCFNFSAHVDKSLSGSLTTNKLSFLQFVLDICELDLKKKEKKNCKDFRKIRKILRDRELQLSILYHESVLKPDDYANPLQRQLKRYINILNVNQMKIDLFYFQNSILEQDDAILFTNEKPFMNMVAISRINSLSNFITDEELDEFYNTDQFSISNSIYSILFSYQQPYKKYLRKYMKVQDVLGNVNGFMEFLILIFNLINFYTNYRFDYFLFNELVNVKIDKGYSQNIKSDNELKKVIDGKDNKDINNNQKENKSYNRIKLNLKTVNDLPKGVNKVQELKYKTESATKNRKICDLAGSDLSSVFAKDSNTTRKLLKKPESECESIKDFSFKENFDLDENLKNLIKEKIGERVYTQFNSKIRYLEPDFFLYYCKSKNKRKAFDLKLLETYLDKINEKFDVFYYLNVNRQFKNLKKFIFKEKNGSTIFKLMARNVYDITISDFNEDYFNKEKNLKIIIEEWINNLKDIKNEDLSYYIYEGIKK